MNAICRTCGGLVSWRNQRGAAMPKLCACGGELVMATWTPEGYRAAERPAQPKRRAAQCCLCGRRGMLPGRLRQLAEPETFSVYLSPVGGLMGSLLATGDKMQQVQAGGIVCRWHESVEERKRNGYEGEPFPVRLCERNQP